jgi:hypothetical protein
MTGVRFLWRGHRCRHCGNRIDESASDLVEIGTRQPDGSMTWAGYYDSGCADLLCGPATVTEA